MAKTSLSLSYLLSSFLQGGVLCLFLLLACTPSSQKTCKKSADCPGSQLCREGKCFTPLGPDESTTEPSGEEKKESLPEGGESLVERPEAPDEGREPLPEPSPEERGPTEGGDGPPPEIPPEDPQEAGEEAPPICREGETRPCYTGPQGTEGIGICRKGQETCRQGTWSPCEGEVLPAPNEDCDGKDNDCNGKTDENLSRSCYGGPAGTAGKGLCKEGTQTCQGGKWSECSGEVRPQPEKCDGLDNDCDQETDETCHCKPGDTQSCGKDTGACQKGKQTCNSQGKWEPCQGEVGPRPETCDGKDNDCDGSTDENNPGGGVSCKTGKPGICLPGTTKCISGALKCVAHASPSNETCDGKDNDCDGLVDEKLIQECYFSGRSGCTYDSKNKKWNCVGACKTGQQICVSGRWGSCSGYRLPITERCRDGQDNDCDGKVDEICGPSYPHAVVTADGKVAKAYKLSVSKKGTGLYGLKATSSSVSCSNSALFVMASSTSLLPLSYTCSSSTFEVRFSNIRGALTNTSFHAILANPASGDLLAWVDGLKCLNPKATCYINYAYPPRSLTVRRISTGVYEVASSSASPCKSSTQPIFATLYASKPEGYVSAAPYRGTCRIYTFDLTGKAADRRFSFWIPNRSRVAWAILSSKGSITASNYFGDATARWTARTIKDIRTFKFSHFEVEFAAWGFPSVVMLTPYSNSPFYAAGVPLKASGMPPRPRYGMALFPFSPTSSSTTTTPGSLSVLFVQ